MRIVFGGEYCYTEDKGVVSVQESMKFKLEIMATKDDMKATAADTVIFEESNGYIIMAFLQTYSPSKDEAGEYSRKAQVVSRVALSWDQFVEMIPRMAGYAQETQEQAEKHHASALETMSSISKKDKQ